MIFPAIWRLLPGPRWVKVLLVLLLILALFAACFRWVYPAIAPWIEVISGDPLFELES
ncbi:hypothetical protein [Demequina pelophila]|uniref:hypothetical protein n=1 Tax=Demequina pelophila TaxID=1638984 RepID=UPI000A7558B4|nr:hypothetical protein [Demequina pelophila]